MCALCESDANADWFLLARYEDLDAEEQEQALIAGEDTGFAVWEIKASRFFYVEDRLVLTDAFPVPQ